MTSILKSNKLNGLSFVCVLAFICLTSATKIPVAADFSGSWTLSESKSELGQFGGRMSATKMKITADANGMTIEKVSAGMGGEAMTTTDKLTFDGKELESEGMMGSKRKSSAKWSADGKSLTVSSLMVFDRDGEKMEMKGTETWTLGADGQTLQIASSTSSSFGEMTSKLVYDKAK